MTIQVTMSAALAMVLVSGAAAQLSNGVASVEGMRPVPSRP